MADHVLAIDQGTTSTRAIVFDSAGAIVSVAQREHEQIMPRAGWVEHDPVEIWTNTEWVIAAALAQARLGGGDIAGVGVTNQRETAIVWDRRTGRPVHNAIVWQDTRTQPRDRRARGARAGHRPLRRDAPACRWRRTSRHRRSPGSSTTCRAPARPPRRATCCSARPTPGSCGT